MRLEVAGPSYTHPHKDINSQRTVNMFLSITGNQAEINIPNQAKEYKVLPKYALLPTPGLQTMISTGGEQVRAIININDTMYTVVDNTVYKLTINDDDLTATKASLGTISSSTGLLKWDYNPTQVMMVDGTSSGYVLTHTTDTLATISDGDFTGGNSVVFFDSYFIYNTPDASTMYATAINDGTSVDALDVATAEGKPDKVVALASLKRELWVLGEKTSEIWYDAANANAFPFSRQEGAWVDIGCSAKESLLNIDDTLMWLDHRGYVVRVKDSSYNIEIVSNPAISAEIQSYTTRSDAKAFTYTDRGHLFYVLTFPTENKTWVYDLASQMWHEWLYFGPLSDTYERHRANCITPYKNYWLVGDHSNGNIYVLKKDVYTDFGDPIHRLRITALYEYEFKLFSIDELEVYFESGYALTSGTGSDPKIMLRYSNDGGHTWSYELVRDIGALGEYDKRVRWNRLGTAREWLFEFRITDPFKFAIIDAYVTVSGNG